MIFEWLSSNALGIVGLVGAGLSYVYLLGRLTARFEATEKDVTSLAEALRAHILVMEPGAASLAVLVERVANIEKDLREHSTTTRETRTEVLGAVTDLRRSIDDRLKAIQDALSRRP